MLLVEPGGVVLSGLGMDVKVEKGEEGGWGGAA
jgi:hypothetical protein